MDYKKMLKATNTSFLKQEYFTIFKISYLRFAKSSFFYCLRADVSTKEIGDVCTQATFFYGLKTLHLVVYFFLYATSYMTNFVVSIV